MTVEADSGGVHGVSKVLNAPHDRYSTESLPGSVGTGPVSALSLVEG